MIKLRLSEVLEKAGISAYRLAQLTEIHETQISRLKSGQAKGITFNTLERICEALHCEPADLLTRIKNASKKHASTPAGAKKLSRKVKKS